MQCEPGVTLPSPWQLGQTNKSQLAGWQLVAKKLLSVYHKINSQFIDLINVIDNYWQGIYLSHRFKSTDTVITLHVAQALIWSTDLLAKNTSTHLFHVWINVLTSFFSMRRTLGYISCMKSAMQLSLIWISFLFFKRIMTQHIAICDISLDQNLMRPLIQMGLLKIII